MCLRHSQRNVSQKQRWPWCRPTVPEDIPHGRGEGAALRERPRVVFPRVAFCHQELATGMQIDALEPRALHQSLQTTVVGVPTKHRDGQGRHGNRYGTFEAVYFVAYDTGLHDAQGTGEVPLSAHLGLGGGCGKFLSRSGAPKKPTEEVKNYGKGRTWRRGKRLDVLSTGN